MNQAACQRLIVFTRYPTPGTTKTRLIPDLGAEGAAALQRQLTDGTMALARTVQEQTGCDIEVRGTGADPEDFSAWLGADLVIRPQAGPDLGARMHQAFDTAFREGAGGVVLIGIDCPYLEPHHIQDAFSALQTHRVALAPAEDGGYTLIGLSAPEPDLFRDVAWGTERVFETTARRVRTKELSLFLLPCLPDLDRYEDVERWRLSTGG